MIRFVDIVRKAQAAWKPPPRLSLSEWADKEFVLSAESAAEPGRWKTIPYQKEILDSFSDPRVEQVSVMKSARVGWTKMINILLAYCVAQEPCPAMVVQPTIEDAEGYSKEEIDPMIRDVPAVARVIDPDDPDQKILHKTFPGGSLSFVGANSARGFRRVSRRVVLFDETDGYPPTAGDEGDQIKLGIRRTEYYWDRKIGAGSTPTIAGASRIEDLFEAGDQRRYHVPCPQCGHMAPLVFREPTQDGEGIHGHVMRWPEGKPEEAFFSCEKNGCVIEHSSKHWMVARGKWVAYAPFKRHASFHIWAAYSYSPNATWGQIAAEFIAAKAAGPEELQTFVNTVLGETWLEKGEAPDWQRLYDRRELYARSIVPKESILLTCGVDVQRNRLVYEVVAWGNDGQSWSVEAGVFPGKPEEVEVWGNLDEMLKRQWPGVDGRQHMLRMLAVDSGDQTNIVYTWARGHPMNRVIATKGRSDYRTLIGNPSPVDVTVNGRRLARGYRVWTVGVDVAKGELYSQLRLNPPTDGSAHFPPGYPHFPQYGEEFFKELTAEHLVRIKKRNGFSRYEWQLLPGRENHHLDCRVLARAAACLAGLDRHVASWRLQHRAEAPPAPAATAPSDASSAPDGSETPAPTPAPPPLPPSVPAPATAATRPPRGGDTWLSRGRGAFGGRGSWLRRS